MTTTAEFTADPLAPASGQFPLRGTTSAEHRRDEPSPAGVRPWGLRRAAAARGAARTLPAWVYDEQLQHAVDRSGRPLIELPVGGPPTANTTASTDGEDPPSSEDWIND